MVSIEISTEALRHFLNECMDDGLAPLDGASTLHSMKDWTMGPPLVVLNEGTDDGPSTKEITTEISIEISIKGVEESEEWRPYRLFLN